MHLYPLADHQQGQVKTLKDSLRCIKEEDMQVWGDSESLESQQIAVTFKLCQGYTYCEKYENILNWLSGKYIVLVQN